jgi:Ca-activated chloride channel homolog
MKKLLHHAASLLLLLAGFACQTEDDLSPEGGYAGDRLNHGSLSGGPQAGGNINAGKDQYAEVIENPFVLTVQEPTSTFSIDADGGSYANARRFISASQLPPKDAIRTEEFINYFQYDYGEVDGLHPIGLNGEVSACPWAPEHRLVRIGMKGRDIPASALPPSNIVLLIDVSGSMNPSDRLPLLKQGFKLFVDQLTADDRLAIVTYAGQAGVALPSTPGDHKAAIKAAIDQLGSGGSTAGAQGIITAYEIAQQHFIAGGNNRVILGTDGDFNVGPSSREELVSLIESKRELGIFLTVLGVGRGNFNDAMLEQLANKGNGTYEYIDQLEQAKKVFLYEFGKFFTVAKDVKVQVHFNPAIVHAYRLIGYENRKLNTEDFEDDEKDAGEIGAGQTITALYEIVPVQGGTSLTAPAFQIDCRYKRPDEATSIPLTLSITDSGLAFEQASENLRFAAAAASFALLLRDSEYQGNTTFLTIRQWASGANSYDPHGLRHEFLQLVQRASQL